MDASFVLAQTDVVIRVVVILYESSGLNTQIYTIRWWNEFQCYEIYAEIHDLGIGKT